jgi:Protein of unknown function (DUF2786)
MTTEQHPKAARIGALLRKAEQAGTPEEADAYLSKAQQLATEYQVDLELARLAHDMRSAPPVPTVRTIRLGEQGKRGLHTYVRLFSNIARVNSVTIDIARNSTFVVAYGFDTDIETTELLYNSLVTQMVAASTAYIRSGAHRSEGQEWLNPRTWVWEFKPVSGTTARISFQKAFAKRVGLRLQEARKDAVQATTTPTTGAELVLAGRQVAVADFYKSRSAARGSYRGGQGGATSAHARRAGDTAGQRARLSNPAAIGGARTAIGA